MWTLVALLWVVGMLNYLDRQVIFSLFPPIQKEFAATNTELGLLGTAFLWVYGLASPLGGWLADRFSRRWVVIAGLAVWSLVTWATGLATSFGALLAARALMGVSEACYLPAALAMISEAHSDRTRSLATGLHQSGLYAGIIVGGWGGGWMGEQYGWRSAFVALGAVGVAYAVVLALALRGGGAAGGRAGAIGGALGRLALIPQFRVVFAYVALCALAFWVIYTWLPTYFYEKFGMSLGSAGFSATFYVQAASFAGILAGGAWSDRWIRSHIRARSLTPGIAFVVAAPFLFLSGGADSRWVVVAGLLVFGFARGCYDANLMPLVCQIVPADLRATAYGVLNMGGCLFGGLMAVLAGAFKDAIGIGGAIQVSAAGVLLAAALLLRLRHAETTG
jgi:MFS family permease